MSGIIDKRVYFTFLTGLTLSGFIVICTMGQSAHRRKTAERISAGVAYESLPDRIVKEYNGRIGVFARGSTVPYRVIDYDISLLSDFDRIQLSEGIEMNSDYELQRFIEDIAT